MNQVAMAPRPLADQRLSLYQWQAEAFTEWIERDHRGVVEAVTGAGKTRLGLAAASEALRTGRRVLLVVPTLELLNQWYGEIRTLLPWARVGRIGDGQRDDLIHYEIVVATVQGVRARLDGQAIDMVGGISPGLLIADECHRYAGEEFSRVLDPRADRRLGLTATFERADELDREVLAPYFGGVIHRLWYDRAREDRLIAPFDIALVGVELRSEERHRYGELSEEIRRLHRSLQGYLVDRVLSAQQFLTLVAMWAKADDMSARAFQARKYLKAVAARQRLLAQTPTKRECLPLLEPALRAAQRTILFSLTQDSAQNAASEIAAIGIRADSIFSDLGRAERSRRMQEFRDGALPVLAAPRILDEGVDVPEADLGLVLAANRSKRQIVQRLGRVIRRKADGRAGKFVVFYAIGTLEDPDVSGDEHLNQVLPHARELGYFTLPDDLDEVLEFLRNPPAVEEVPPPLLARLPEPQAESTGPTGPRAHPGGNVLPLGTPGRPGAPGPTALEPRSLEPEIEPDPEPEPEPIVELPDWDGDPIPALGGLAHVTDDAVKDYLKKIARYRLVNAEEEVDLAQRIEAGLFAQERLDTVSPLGRRERRELKGVAAEGRRAKAMLTAANLRLVVSIAKNYMKICGTLDFLDLIQEGNQGLNRAVEKFDYAHGTKFSTYATWWIRQSITRAMADTSRTIRVPVHVVEKLRNLQSVLRSDDFEELDWQDAVSVAAQRLEMQPARAQQLLALDREPLSLEADWWVIEDDRATLGTLSDVLVDEADDGVEVATTRSMLQEQLEQLLDSLSEREAGVIRMRFGLSGFATMTLDQIGEVYGVTRERIRQIEKKTMDKLQHPSRSQQLRDYLEL